MSAKFVTTSNPKVTCHKNILGTVQGSGYDCRKEKGDGDINRVEGSTNGVWNKVSEHVAWIRKTAENLGEIFCDDQNGEESDKVDDEEVNGRGSEEKKSEKDSEEKKSGKEDDEKKSDNESEEKNNDKDSKEKKSEKESEEKKSDKDD